MEKLYFKDNNLFNIQLHSLCSQAYTGQKDIDPGNFDKMKVEFSSQELRQTVAAGKYTYLSFNQLPPPASDTASLIEMMDKLFDLLNSLSTTAMKPLRKAMTATSEHANHLKAMLHFFKSLKIIDPKSGQDVTKRIKCIYERQITNNAVLQLFEDFK